MIKVKQDGKDKFTITSYDFIDLVSTVYKFSVENVNLETVKKFLIGRNIDELELEYGYERLGNQIREVVLHENRLEIAV